MGQARNRGKQRSVAEWASRLESRRWRPLTVARPKRTEIRVLVPERDAATEEVRPPQGQNENILSEKQHTVF